MCPLQPCERQERLRDVHRAPVPAPPWPGSAAPGRCGVPTSAQLASRVCEGTVRSPAAVVTRSLQTSLRLTAGFRNSVESRIQTPEHGERVLIETPRSVLPESLGLEHRGRLGESSTPPGSGNAERIRANETRQRHARLPGSLSPTPRREEPGAAAGGAPGGASGKGADRAAQAPSPRPERGDQTPLSLSTPSVPARPGGLHPGSREP